MKLSKELKIGALVIVTLAITIWGFNWLKGNNILIKKREYFAVYKNVGGLTESSPVQINGFQVGNVSSIELMENKPGYMIVGFRITDKNFQFPKDSYAKLASAGLLSGKIIDIVLGDSSVMAVSGDTLLSGFELDLQGQVNELVKPLKIKVENLLSNLDSLIIPIQTILNDETATKIAEGLGRIPRIIQNLESITYKVDTLISSEKGKFARIITNVESISTNLRNNNEKITEILDNVEEITDSIAKSNFKKAIQNATNILETVDEMTTKINNGEGTLGALINDDKLYLKLDSAAKNLNVLVGDITENPEKYLHFSFIHINKNKGTNRRQKRPNN